MRIYVAGATTGSRTVFRFGLLGEKILVGDGECRYYIRKPSYQDSDVYREIYTVHWGAGGRIRQKSWYVLEKYLFEIHLRDVVGFPTWLRLNLDVLSDSDLHVGFLHQLFDS